MVVYNLILEQVGLLNVDGYYNSLLSFIDKAVDEGFIKPNDMLWRETGMQCK